MKTLIFRTNNLNNLLDLEDANPRPHPHPQGEVILVEHTEAIEGSSPSASYPPIPGRPKINGIIRYPPRPVKLGVKANLYDRLEKITKNVQQISTAFDSRAI